MGVYLNPGYDAFQMSVNDDIYIDKSGMIAFVNGRIGKRKRFICVSRPRRFGNLDFLTDLFKDRTYVKAAYMTGILPIKKYGTHSALNIFDEFSMITPGKLAKYVGFTESEVRKLCREHKMKFSEAKKWYDGYHFKRVRHMYNPKSIVDAMTEEDFRSYWTSTETYEALQIYIDMDIDGLREAIVSMLSTTSIKIDTGIDFTGAFGLFGL